MQHHSTSKSKFPNQFLIQATCSILHKTLTNIIIEHSNVANNEQTITETPFTSQYPPQIPIDIYLNRIISYTQIELNTIINSLIYIDRFCTKTNTQLTFLNIHKLLICGILISIKYNEDIIFQMDYYANIFGVSLYELRKLERAFVMDMEFDFYVGEEQFKQYKEYIYTEIKVLAKQYKEQIRQMKKNELKIFT